MITDSAGNIKAESDYYPWGGELQFTNNDSNHYKFTGKERDTETGLDYFGARYYSNGLGRWVSADWSAVPIPVPYANLDDPQSLNLYGYVRNIPTTQVDADGHDGWDTVKTLVSLVEAGFDAGQQGAGDAAQAFAHFMTSPDPTPHAIGPFTPPSNNCASPQTNNQGANNQNNSQSSNTAEQGRDAQGKFTSKQPGQAAPGAAAEKEGLDSVGAVKNTEKLNGTVRDGTIPETGQHVEVKSGASVSNTEQLREMGQTAMTKQANR